jgi:hypothetical protein
MEETNETITLEVKRPTFLTVLCILTFVGAGLNLIMSIVNYFSYSAMASTGGNFLNSLGGGESDQLAQSVGALAEAFGMDFEKMAMVSLIQALINIPILIGALLMWKQKKAGFYVYTAFELTQPIIPLAMGLGMLGGMMAVFGIVFAVIFIVLYALNLKHMS